MSMNNILIVDVETTGLSPEKDKIIEIATVLYNVPHRTVLQCMSTLLPVDSNPVEHINGIKAEASKEVTSLGVAGVILMQLNNAEFVVAHNASFDRSFMIKEWPLAASSLKWICTYRDFAWHEVAGSRRLTNIAKELGINADGAHRALADCMLLANCFSKIDDLEERLNRVAG